MRGKAPDGTAEVRFTLRLPKKLHRKASAQAKAMRRTLSEWIREAMELRLDQG